MKISRGKAPVLCGIKIDSKHSNKIEFNWDFDDKDDVLHLCENTSGQIREDSIQYVYGFEYNNHANFEQISILRDQLKHPEKRSRNLQKDFQQFLEMGIGRLDSFHRVRDFQVIVRAKSYKKSSLVDEMTGQIVDLMDQNADFTEFSLVKETYNNVKFDTARAKTALRNQTKLPFFRIEELVETAEDKFEGLKSSGQLFQMKNFVPSVLRNGFSNFLKFENEEQRNLYNNLQGVNVLLYDDFLTSGTTLREMSRCLNSIHSKNQLTAFSLVKQH